ncbi:DUF1476 domain-containing protein [Roseivivax sp. CAU 1761]
MTTFDERERAFEAKFAHDEEMRFRAAARGYRLLGLWAAERKGLSGAEADAYARELVRSDLEVNGAEAAVARVAGDPGVRADADTVRERLAECFAEAKRQFTEDAAA